MKKSTEQFFAIVPPGFEQLCAHELSQIVSSPVAVEHGGVFFEGKLRELYLANLWLRCASRVLVRLDTFGCRDFPTLFRKAARLPWGRFIKPGRAIQVRVSCHQSRLNHTNRIAETLTDAITKALGSGINETEQQTPPQLVFVRFDQDQCQLSIDSSGELLHRRGYRGQMTPAPMRETLAAGCLMHFGWHGEKDFCDLLCGSGTLAIEAALIAANLPPGRQRSFAFQQWPGYRDGLWQALLSEARQQQQAVQVHIQASDLCPDAIAAARHNSQRAGVSELLTLSQQDYQLAKPPSSSGLWLSNPPYGERLKSDLSTRQLYTALQRKLEDDFPGWRGGVIFPQQQMSAAATLKFRNGGLAVGLYPLHKSRSV